MGLKDLFKQVQRAMNAKGSKLVVDGDLGPASQAEMENFDFEVVATKKQKQEEPAKSGAPWMKVVASLKGKGEKDSKFVGFMSGFWKLFGLPFKTIVGSTFAWCGLLVAVALHLSGFDIQKDGAGAKNWDKFGQAIDWVHDGIPYGAVVRINHKANCKSASDNHVTFSNSDCTAKDVAKGGSFVGEGGNQADMVKDSNYPIAHICSVRWPPNSAKPGPVLISKNCGGSSSKESTR